MKPFRTYRHLRWITAIAVGAGLAILVLGGNAASAALPKKGGRYSGRTSQGESVFVKVDRKGRIDFLDVEVQYPCSRVGPVRTFEFASDMRVKKDGSFSQTFINRDLLDEGFDIEGRERRLFSVAKNQVSGRFVTSRKATGTWRARNALYDVDLFPANSDPIDKCDTGVVSWTARLRR